MHQSTGSLVLLLGISILLVSRTEGKECYCLQQKISPQGCILYSILQKRMLTPHFLGGKFATESVFFSPRVIIILSTV